MDACSSFNIAFQERLGVDEDSARKTSSFVESVSRDQGVVDGKLDYMRATTFPDCLGGYDCGIILWLYVRGNGGG